VGAGPGDAGLITVRGRQRLRRADVVVYDRLVGRALLDLVPPHAILIDAGKTPGASGPAQAAIEALLIRHARLGRRVVRLKGGDPFVFGRGGEEASALAAAGVRVDVVPGVTSAIAVPAAVGIPVTHRGLSSSFAVVTGHEDPAKPSPAVDWRGLAGTVDTLVILMAVERLAAIVEELRAGGRAATTPVALVRWGTTPWQRSVVGTLEDIVERARTARLGPPAIVVVGEVVRLAGRTVLSRRTSRSRP
jgi:uroporphyrin-III C-methyltransferase